MITKPHLRFEFNGYSKSGTTRIYLVFTLNHSKLGTIKFYSKWRNYGFYPEKETLFDSSCLGEIQTFINNLNFVRKEEIKKKKPPSKIPLYQSHLDKIPDSF